jgi:hypothetical protein
MAKKPKSGEYPETAIPFDVNQSFTLTFTKDGKFEYYLFQGEPDAEEIYPYVKVSETPEADAMRVEFYVRKGPYGAAGSSESMAFSGTGHSPIENVMSTMGGPPYGGTATF